MVSNMLYLLYAPYGKRKGREQYKKKRSYLGTLLIYEEDEKRVWETKTSGFSLSTLVIWVARAMEG